MAQYKKDEIKKRILLNAKEEFMEKGFLNSSMRDIAKKSKISVSNMYNYFINKEELFQKIVKDVYQEILHFNTTEAISMYYTRIDHYESDLEKTISQLISYVAKNKEVLKLLLIKSTGSQYADFRNELKELYYDIEVSTAKEKFKTHPQVLKKMPSEDLIKSLCDLYINPFEKFLRDQLSESELRIRLNELNEFLIHGINFFLQ
ncbi:TetR/AcrR family transcriptional regulator [Vallitalea okinawensis]|uniref:TetR/AcrR family transcriptional regulator n=1 Tax=Vallitalea okinawensis TaxID=2078660 RepID=UPI000CFAFFDB|nr:TetR/AcrR family transcriptional regulator [Vallitalea okinawensis]